MQFSLQEVSNDDEDETTVSAILQVLRSFGSFKSCISTFTIIRIKKP
jgi:hypothetical protein